MEKPAGHLTDSQQKAVIAPGNVLVMAGAGTGKTGTLVERCLYCVEHRGAALDELLVVTFTEAAAAEMRERLRRTMDARIQGSAGEFWAEQLARFDLAHIGTLHSFCFKLVREHFYELGLDPQLSVLDPGEARQLASETMEEQFAARYAGVDDFSLAAQNLIQIHGGGRDERIRQLILRLHHYSQARPDAAGWFAQQLAQFSAARPAGWEQWLLAAVENWRDEWLAILENLGAPSTDSAGRAKGISNHAEPVLGAPAANEKAAELIGILQRLAIKLTRQKASDVLAKIISADDHWPQRRKTVLREPLEDLFEDAKFLLSLASEKNGADPLAEDWSWVRGHMETLLRLAEEFGERFSEAKRAEGMLDFQDLEQFALKLLWNFSSGQPTRVAENWRAKLKFVFVDEYQDINAAQDRIIQALSREGADANRFLVGDVKQSIYRFRLADPKIFREYAATWRGRVGQTIPLAENFRSRESLLNFINGMFGLLMREEVGGVGYDDEAKLKFGRRWGEAPVEPSRNDRHSPAAAREDAHPTNNEPRAELLLRVKPGRDADAAEGEFADLVEAEKEARLVAWRLKELVAGADPQEIWDERKKILRAAEWRDAAVLLRSPAGKAEIFAKEFARVGVPLVVERGGFYDSSAILDLLSLLQLLDNPLQDIPCIAVLRSPLVGCSLDELAEIRLAGSGHFWFALDQLQNSKVKIDRELRAKVETFLERFQRWRKLARQSSLSECLEAVLAETFYADWLRSRPRGAQLQANVAQFLHLAGRFDRFRRQGLFRFLKFIKAQREVEAEPDVPAIPTENAVRLMSIHQSKGLEFPVVVVADLAKRFNEQDLRGDIIFDEEFGVCPKVQSPDGRRYPSLPHWLAQRRQRLELRGEELRLLYVAMTRARDRLILTGSIAEKMWRENWNEPSVLTPRTIAGANSVADWLGQWFARTIKVADAAASRGELAGLRWRLVEDAELANGWGDTIGEPVPADGRSGSRERPPHQPKPLDDATAKKLHRMLAWEYPFVAATKLKAKSSVTELRRAAEESDDEAEPVFQPQRFSSKRPRGELSAADAGVANHKFLQYVSLEKTGDRTALAGEAERLVREKILSEAERSVLNVDALADFWNSAPGKSIRTQPSPSVKRELPFTARFSPAELAQILGKAPAAGLEDEFLVVQGVVDLVVLSPEEIWLVDFKTDRIRADELAARQKAYEPQLRLYARALAGIYSRPVTRCWLHFLDVRKTVDVTV